MPEQKCCCVSSRYYEDCRYYRITFDMGANIAHCVLNPPSGMDALSYCPCIDSRGKCEQYISKKDPNGDFIAGQQRTIDRVLEIIDSEAWSYCDYIIKHENGNGDKQGAASHLADNIREAVEDLKGGEQ